MIVVRKLPSPGQIPVQGNEGGTEEFFLLMTIQIFGLTLPEILRQHGFEVAVAATVPEALKIISTENFEVLLSDLNIGEPGDGFTVVSAMRRIQPSATTIILTGYPAFESALRAIQSQVDDYLVKPADIASLVGKIRGKAGEPYSSPAGAPVASGGSDPRESAGDSARLAG